MLRLHLRRSFSEEWKAQASFASWKPAALPGRIYAAGYGMTVCLAYGWVSEAGFGRPGRAGPRQLRAAAIQAFEDARASLERPGLRRAPLPSPFFVSQHLLLSSKPVTCRHEMY